jgi:hypothetical protein
MAYKATLFAETCEYGEDRVKELKSAFVVQPGHTDDLMITIRARDQFLIVPSSAAFVPGDRNNAEQVSTEIAPDRCCLTIHFSLKGGQFDKSFRWLIGTLRYRESKR